jgi:hypothetical protein
MNIINIMLWMKRNAYEETTIKKTAKLLIPIQIADTSIHKQEADYYVSLNVFCSVLCSMNLFPQRPQNWFSFGLGEPHAEQYLTAPTCWGGGGGCGCQ